MEIINKGGILALIGPAIAGYGACFTGISMDSEFTSTISYSENSMSYRKKQTVHSGTLSGEANYQVTPTLIENVPYLSVSYLYSAAAMNESCRCWKVSTTSEAFT